MTEQEALVIYEQALTSLDAYIATQVTKDQILGAKHRKHHLEINKNYFLHSLVEDEPYRICKHCGTIEFGRYYDPIGSRLMETGVCFHCDHWEQIAANPKPGRFVIDGKLYSDGGHQEGGRKDCLGFGGHLWTIKQGDLVWKTNDLWSGGTIPNEFRDRLSDNAEFLTSGIGGTDVGTVA